ncbi:MAG: M24 family metallopeptidase [Acetobacteraceae bacterium]
MTHNAAAKLAALRAALAQLGLGGFIVPRADEHLGEYVPPSAERLAWLTGFTGSAGMAVVLAETAAVFTDGRYTLQLAVETDPACFERCHITETPPQEWTARHAPKGVHIGYDPRLIGAETLARFAGAGLTLRPVAANPIDALWTDRPAPPRAPAVVHPLRYAGREAAAKRADIAAALARDGQDAAVLTDPASIAWLLNLRGGDLAFVPVALGFAIIDRAGRVRLFMEPDKLGPETRAALGNDVTAEPPAALEGALRALSGRTVRVDPQTAPVWFADTLRAAGARVADAADPCALPKAVKNPTEQAGARAAHASDAVALIRFLHWLAGAAGTVTEAAAAARLLALRAERPGFRGESFPAISGAGEHGAIIHYRVTPETDRPIRRNEVYLIDSGAQFPEGTTDVTRTVWTGPDPAPAALREHATLVLKGHIAVATLVFPEGLTGVAIDAFARRALWQAGRDFDHGTGHGVGSFLSVHEGPVSLSRLARPVPLAAGMILSDEPGFYLSGQYGIRHENLLLVQPALPDASRRFLGFETLTLAPFDRALIDPALLDAGERAWLDAYHARVLAEVGPALPPDARAWLASACAPLPG